jgi:hypothetical protein
MGDFSSFFSQIGPLLVEMFVLLVLLIVLWTLFLLNRRRRTKGLPGIGTIIWRAIVNFFMEPPEEREQREREKQEKEKPAETAAASDDAAAPAAPAVLDAADAAASVEPVADTAASAEPAEASAGEDDDAEPLEEPTPRQMVPTDEIPPHVIPTRRIFYPPAAKPVKAPAGEGSEAEAPSSAGLGAVVSLTGGSTVSPAEAHAPASSSGAVPVEPPADAPGKTGETAQTPPAAGMAAPSDAVEVLRVWRDIADGSLIIDFGAQRCRHPAELVDPDLRRRFIAVARELNSMADNMGAPGIRHAAPPPAAAPPPVASPPPEPPDIEAPQEEKPGMLRQVGRVMMGKSPTPGPLPSEIEPPSIVEQIEEILQAKLQNSEFSQRSIHVRPSITGGVTVQVDDVSYEGIDAVREDDVREFLQTVIREWEARQ